jgi:cytoskeletal protein RodZ
MTVVGEKLRRERVRQGIGLADLAHDTRINLKYLEAIESGDSSRIPGGFFYRSFVRQYALALSMDPGELESDLERNREAEAAILSAALAAAQFPIKQPDPMITAANHRPASGRTWTYVLLLVGVAAGCSMFYSWWRQIETGASTAIARPAARVPDAKAEAVPARNQPVSRPISNPDAGVAARTEPAATMPVAVPEPGDKVVIELSVREATWLSISSDGKTVFSGMLEPSQTKVLGGKSRTLLRVGNAGALEITWNGKPIPPIGGRGQVKNVVFTPENYRILSQAGGSL